MKPQMRCRWFSLPRCMKVKTVRGLPKLVATPPLIFVPLECAAKWGIAPPVAQQSFGFARWLAAIGAALARIQGQAK